MRRIPSDILSVALGLVLPALVLTASPGRDALAAGPDGNVEWSGISHVDFLDRTPACPLAGRPLALRVQSWADDLTAVRVRLDDGAVTTVEASRAGSRGPYDVWQAQVPAPAGDVVEFVFELVDGADTDYLGPAGVADDLPATGFVLDFTTLSHAPYGATPIADGGVVFRVWSPDRTTCSVRGEFNGWGTADPMTRVGEDFVRRVPAAAAGDMYKYWFQGTTWNTDARARALNPGDNYNAVVVDPAARAWQVDDFDTPDFEQMVVYQLHVGTFAGLNDPHGATAFPSRYADVAARVDHLADLGVNVVQLCPITEFPWDYSAGYNPVTQWAPESYYGDPDDLRAMVDALHARGIAVILDIVWNHLSYSDNFLWYYDGTQLYFDDPAVETPWGSQADLDREGVRRWYLDSARMWLGEYRLDGFRVDATGYLNIYPQEASGWSLMQQLNDDMDRRWIDKICIAEQLPDNAWVTRPTGLGGAGFDCQYHDRFTDRLREQVLAAAYGDPDLGIVADILDGSGAYLEGRYVLNYLELHDEAWPSSGGQRLVKTIDTTAPHDDEYARGRVKLAQGLVLTAPGIPAILQGTEWLEDNDFGSDAANRIDWSHKTTYAGIFAFFRDLVHLRTGSPALRADAAIEIFHVDDAANVIAFRRTDHAGHDVVVVANFSNGDLGGYRLGVPLAGFWWETVNSQDPAYMGGGPTNPGPLAADAVPRDGYDQSLAIDLAAMALVVLRPLTSTGVGEPGGAGPAGGATVGLRLQAPRPNPVAPGTRVVFDLARPGRARVAVHDMAGRLVRVLGEGDYPAGRSEVAWDGADRRGRRVAAGVYLVRVEAGGRRAHRKVIVVR